MSKRGFQNLMVLLVDDHANMRRLWTAILKSFGITNIKEADGAYAALDILRTDNIDIAIVDLILNDLSGAELIHMIRNADDSPDPMLPIIACTADSRRSVIYNLINAGVDEILTKPVSPSAAWQRFLAVTTKRRDFIRTADFFGPDRRRAQDPSYSGPERRGQAEEVFL